MGNLKNIELKIPNLGDAESTEIIEVNVKKGDKIDLNSPLLVLESEKAAMEVPSDYSGEITEILVKEGDEVSEGLVFAKISVNEDVVDKKLAEAEEKKENIHADKKLEPTKPNLDKKTIAASHGQFNVGPAVRKYARELDIDLSHIKGTGSNNRITKDDLKRYIHSLKNHSFEKFYDFEELKSFGDYELHNQSKIRQYGAENLKNAWTSIPHVTHFEEADLTNLEAYRKKANETSKIKITPLSYIAKAVSVALKEFPIFNSSIVDEGKIMIRKYINMGIAVSTNDGLLVPVIKDIDTLSVEQIAIQISGLSEKARKKKIMTDDLKGATFSISSLGQIGGTGFTPIINPPEVAIIGLSRATKKLELINNDLVEKNTLPFSLSYDHRVINGVDAGNFCTKIRHIIENEIDIL